MTRLARWLLRRPSARRGPVRRPGPTRLFVLPLEDRLVPAKYVVQVSGPTSDTAAYHAVDMSVEAAYAAPEQTVVEASDARAAAASVLTHFSGSIDVYYAGQSATYTYSAGAVNTTGGSGAAFGFVGPASPVQSGTWTLGLEDLADPVFGVTPDWDYNDEVWAITASPFAPQDLIPAGCTPPGGSPPPGGGGGGTAPNPNAPCPNSPAPVRYADGTLSLSATDLGSAGGGLPWGVTRSWTNAFGYDDGGPLGGGWVMDSAPHLVPSGDSLVAVLGGTAAYYFDPDGMGGFAERHPAGMALTYDSGAGEYVLTDGTGAVVRFSDFDVSRPPLQQGAFASYTSPAGESIAAFDYDADGRMTEARRVFGAGGSAVTESYLYAYGTTGPEAGRLTAVTLRRKVGAGSWATVRSVEYGYYGGAEAHGSWGDLKTATVRDAAGAAVDTSYYRYYKLGEAGGYFHGLRSAFGPAATARLIADQGSDLDAIDDGDAVPYADLYFEYDSSHRVTREVASGEGCSACSNGQGEYTYAYTASGNAAGVNSWSGKTVVGLPDGTTDTVYTDSFGRVMLKDHSDGTGHWVDYYEYDAGGRVVLHASPSAVTGYDEADADLIDFEFGNAYYLADDAGLLTVYSYYASTTATTTTAGGAAGYTDTVSLRHGETGDDVPQETKTYIARDAGGHTVYAVAADTVYRNDDGTGGETTNTAYTWYSGTAQASQVVTTLPTVTTAQNGPNAATTLTTVYDAKGRVVWTKDADGFIGYMAYDDVSGAVVKTITDVNTANTSDFTNLPSGWSTPSGGGLHLITTYEVDALGRTTKAVSPGGVTVYTVYDDAGHEARSYTWDTTAGARVGPTTVVREDRAGGYTETLTMSATPATSSGRPTGTESISGVLTLSRSYTNDAHQVTHADAYFDLAGVTYSTAADIGTLNANYYRTTYGYDHYGRPNKVVSPAGTITRTEYDGRGRAVSVWVGTDDTPTTGYWSVTNLTGTNMTEVTAYEYDGGDDGGDSNLTTVTQYPGLGAPDRVTATFYDWRDRAVVVQAGVTVPTFQPLASDDFSADPGPITWATVNGTWSQSDGVYSQTDTDYAYVKKAVVADPGCAADQEIAARVRVDDWEAGDYARAGVGVRTDAGSGAGYNLVFHGDDTVQFLDDGVAWGNAYSFDWEVGTWYTFKLRVEGNVLLGKVWADGDAEPADWMFEQDGWTDRTGGSPALNGGSSGDGWATVSFDDVEVKALGTGPTGTPTPITYTDYDNLGEVTKTRSYDGDGVTVTSTGGVPDAPSSSLLRAQTVYAYDELGRAYRTSVYSVDPSSGSVSSSALTTDVWYDARGMVVKTASPGGLVTKTSYDGAGRVTVTYATDGGGDSGYSDADDVTGDTVLSQGEYAYDADGDVILATARERFHDATGTGALGSPSSSQPKARVSYSASYYDAADRLVASVDVGTNGASSYTRPGSVPSRSDTVLVTGYEYDAAGRLWKVTDPKGIESRTEYDALGRTTKTIQNYVDGTVSDTDDKTTVYAYGPAGLLSLTAQTTGGGGQTTGYVYGVTTGSLSGVSSNDIQAITKWPDPSTGAASTSEEDTVTVNALGQVVTRTDRNGTTHRYEYDVLGRLTADKVDTLGSLTPALDGTVARIEYAYDALGNLALVTSYNATTGGTVVNQVQRAYNGLGQLVSEWQAHGGAVNTSTSPKVDYAYSEMPSGANHSRLTSITYPGGYVLTYTYASGLDASISRLSSLSDSGGTLESYDYLGLGTVVDRHHPQPGVDLSFVKLSGESVGDAGDQYTGLDRFGRVVDQRWLDSTSGTAKARLQYGYDRDSNRLYRDDLMSASAGELYTYDGLGQVASFDRGTLNGGKTAISGSASRTMDWDYDAVGNFAGVDLNGATTTRTHDAQNEVTGVGGATLTYDPNGNLTTDETGRKFVYDAWNRLVQVKTSGGTLLKTYAYDGLGRRISETPNGGSTTDLYYSAGWQVLEERVAGTTTARYVWSPVYVDALILRDRDTDSNGTLDERLYALQDANFNVIALVDASGNVVERYAYDPFGARTVLDGSYGSRSSSSYAWTVGFQGMAFDAVAGLSHQRARWYSPTLGRWVTIDPLGYRSGDVDLYRMAENNPTGFVDPSGLQGVARGPSTIQCHAPSQASPPGFKLDPRDPLHCALFPSVPPPPQPFVPKQNFIGPAPPRTPAEDAGRAGQAVGRALRDGDYAGALRATAPVAQELFFGVVGTMAAAPGSAYQLPSSITNNTLAGSFPTPNTNPRYPYPGHTTNCVNTALATEFTLAGQPSSAMPSGPRPLSVIPRQLGINGFFEPAAGPGQIVSMMGAIGPGARGIVAGRRPNGDWHTFNTVVDQNGVVHFIDGTIPGPVRMCDFDKFLVLPMNNPK